jgi:hypothetical protein
MNFDDLHAKLITHPRTFENIGRFFAGAGCMSLAIGLLLLLAQSVQQALATLSPQSAPIFAPLAESVTFPTWWIPESLSGYVAAMIVAGVGFWLIYYTRLIRRLMHLD